ncbi:hypothetical protein D9754_15140 [Planomicrobium sp. Y74]|nr:hypothetical protein D9754_15140 [Planomicrobium sp. Y74]
MGRVLSYGFGRLSYGYAFLSYGFHLLSYKTETSSDSHQKKRAFKWKAARAGGGLPSGRRFGRRPIFAKRGLTR